MDSLNILGEYGFESASYQKIIDRLSSYFKENETLKSTDFVNFIPKELVVTFDTWLLFPLSKFQDEQDYEEELETVSKELKRIYLKEKIKDISERLKTGKVGDDEEKILKERLSKIVSLLSPLT